MVWGILLVFFVAIFVFIVLRMDNMGKTEQILEHIAAYQRRRQPSQPDLEQGVPLISEQSLHEESGTEDTGQLIETDAGCRDAKLDVAILQEEICSLTYELTKARAEEFNLNLLLGVKRENRRLWFELASVEEKARRLRVERAGGLAGGGDSASEQ